MATCSRACQPCGLSSRGAISDQELGKLRKRRCNTRDLLERLGVPVERFYTADLADGSRVWSGPGEGP